jgi:hypothetical protein
MKIRTSLAFSDTHLECASNHLDLVIFADWDGADLPRKANNVKQNNYGVKLGCHENNRC